MISDIINSIESVQEELKSDASGIRKQKQVKSKTKEKKVKLEEVQPEQVPEVKAETELETVKPSVQELVPEELPINIRPPSNSIPSKDDLFVAFMNNIDVSKMNLTELDKAAINNNIAKLQSSDMGLIRQCNSETCQQRNICPFNSINKFPENQLCPVEKAIVQYMQTGYYKLLEEELGHTNYNMIEVGTIHSLLEVDIEEFRARVYTNETGMIVQNAAFIDKESGSVIFNNVENPIYNLRERLDRRKAKLLQRLLLTPESKARFKIESKDRSSRTTKDLISSAEDKIKRIQQESKHDNK